MVGKTPPDEELSVAGSSTARTVPPQPQNQRLFTAEMPGVAQSVASILCTMNVAVADGAPAGPHLAIPDERVRALLQVWIYTAVRLTHHDECVHRPARSATNINMPMRLISLFNLSNCTRQDAP